MTSAYVVANNSSPFASPTGLLTGVLTGVLILRRSAARGYHKH